MSSHDNRVQIFRARLPNEIAHFFAHVYRSLIAICVGKQYDLLIPFISKPQNYLSNINVVHFFHVYRHISSYTTLTQKVKSIAITIIIIVWMRAYIGPKVDEPWSTIKQHIFIERHIYYSSCDIKLIARTSTNI